MQRPVYFQDDRYSLFLKALKALVAVVSALFVLLFLYAAVRRMLFPFEVEWIESGMLVSALRITHGQGLYVRPTLDFVPYLYAPLYLYLSAALIKLLGGAQHGYLAMRLLSTLATLGNCGLIYTLVIRETRRHVTAIAAAGLFIGCYSVADSYFDVGRVDSLFVFFILLALLAQREGYPIIAGLVWVLAFQTKQTVLPLGLFILCAEWQRPRRAIAGALTFLVAAGVSVLWWNHATGGWYGFYLFHLARGLPVVWRQAFLFVPEDLLAPVSIAWAVLLAALVLTRPRLSRAMFYLFVSVALYGGLWFVAAHRGASSNALMPAYAWTAVLFGVALARLLRWAEEANDQRATVVVMGAAALQLVALIYNPGRYIPPRSAADASRNFVEKLRSIPGDVYVVNHSYDAILAGKQPHAEGEAMGAVLDAKLANTSAGLQQELDAAVTAHQYSAVVIDDASPSQTSWHFERSYPLAVSSPLQGFRYYTSQPEWFLFPCEKLQSLPQAFVPADARIVSNTCNVR